MAATKSDLKDRGWILQLERIDEERRREDVEIRAEANSLRPQLLSYIFDILVQVLQVKQNGGIKLKRLPRMADYTKHYEMIARCMGYPENTFLDVFNRNVKVQVQESVSANPVAIVLIRFMKETLKIRQILTIKAQDKDSRYNDYCSLIWRGNASALLHELVNVAAMHKIDVYQKAWPKSHNALSYKLGLASADLKEFGISVLRGTDAKTKLRYIEVRKTSSLPSPSSVASDIDQNHAQNTDKKGDYLNAGSPPGDDVIERSPPKTLESRAQNQKGDGGCDGDDLFRTLQREPSTEAPMFTASQAPQQLTSEQNQMIERLGNYGTFRCKICNYKDDKQGMSRHMQYYHSASTRVTNEEPQGRPWEI